MWESKGDKNVFVFTEAQSEGIIKKLILNSAPLSALLVKRRRMKVWVCLCFQTTGGSSRVCVSVNSSIQLDGKGKTLLWTWRAVLPKCHPQGDYMVTPKV